MTKKDRILKCNSFTLICCWETTMKSLLTLIASAPPTMSDLITSILWVLFVRVLPVVAVVAVIFLVGLPITTGTYAAA